MDITETVFNGSELVLTVSASSNSVYVNKFTVTYETSGGDEPTVATPTFSLEEGTYNGTQYVTISCETDDATIYYSTDDGENWNEYTSTLTISQTTTLKAKAVKGEVESEIATATYTITYNPVLTVGTAELTINDNGTNNSFTVKGEYLKDNIGVKRSSTSFEPTLTATVGQPRDNWDNGTHYFWFERNGANVDGSVAVNYTGTDLYAEGTITMGTKPYTNAPDEEDITKTVTVYYRPDIYILGDFGNGWNFNDPSHKMTFNGTNYTATVQMPANSYFVFARKLTESSDGLWNDGRSYFGPSYNNWPVNGNVTNEDLALDQHNVFKVNNEGEYTITIDPEAKKFSIVSTNVANIADAQAFTGGKFTFTGNAVVTYQNGEYMWIRDVVNRDGEVNSGLIKGSLDGTFTNGDVLKSGWKATKNVENTGVIDFINPEGVTLDVNNGPVAPYALTELTDADINKYVSMSGLTVTRVNYWQYTVTADGTNTFYIYDQFHVTDGHKLEVDKTYNVVGVVSRYNGDPQLYLISAEEVQKVETPTFEPAAGTYYEAKSVTIACETEDAIIHYTTDGSEPTATSAVYSAAIPVSETTTIKAIAMKEGWLNSSIAEAVYTIKELGSRTKYTKVTNTSDLTNGNYLIVYEGGNVAFDGSLEELDATKNTFDVEISSENGNNIIYTDIEGYFTINVTNGTIKSASNKYIGRAGDSNGLDQSDEALTNTISMNGTNVKIEGANGAIMRYNTDDNQQRFRYYKSSSYSSQKAIQLYKEVKDTPVPVDAELSYGEEPVVKTATVGDETFEEPTLINPHSVSPITYSSNPETVATVNAETGEVTIVGAGTAVITASFEGNDEYLADEATYTIEVSKKDVNLAFGETPANVYKGNEITLTVTGAPEGATVTFECTPEGAVTFDGNKATFNTEGEVTITAKTAETAEYKAGSVSKTFNVQAKTTPTLTFTPDKVELYVGQEFTAPTLNGLPEGATVVYTVENENPEVVVATVENNVVAITGTAGKATVTATYAGSNQYNNTSASYPITISKKDVTLAFGDTPDVYVGNEVTLTVTGAPEGATVTFECAPEGAVTFDGNKATFKTEGPVTITAKTAATDEYNAGEVSKTFNVQAKKEAGLSFGENPNVEITLGDTFTAPQLVNPYNLPVTWTSSNPDVATVDQDGNVTLVAGAIGSTTITATYTTGEGSGYETGSARYTITVNDVVVALAAPTFAPAAGTYTEPKEVAIACATPGVTITYAIDGVDKGEYNGPFTISDGEHTVTATAKMGTRTVYTPATAEAQYTINAAAAAEIADNYYYLQNNALSDKYANVAGRRTLNFVDNPDAEAGTIFRIATDGNGKVLTLRSQACDIQDYAKRAMNYVPTIVQTVINKLNNTTDVDSISGAGNLLGENGLQALLDKFNECFDYNLYVEGNENAYRIYARTPSMQNVVDFYRDHKAQVDEKLPMLEDYINQVLAKIRSKVQAANLNPQVFEDFSLLTLWEEMGKKLIKPDSEENVKRFYEQVLTNKEYVWDFAYYTAKHYLDNIKGTTTYQNLINLHPEIESVYLDKLEEIRPETKFFIIQNGNEPDYVSETHIYITGNDAKTYWTLTPRTDYNVTFPAENVYNGQLVTTLYTDFAYDVPEGVTAYTVTGVKTVNEQAIAEIEALNGTVPAQTPVLLMTPAAKANVTKTVTLNTNNGTPIENELKGPDYLIKNYGINSPTVQAIFNMAAGLVPADMLAQYAYLKLRTSGTVNNKYFWNVNDALDSCIVVNQNNLQDCIVRCLSTKTGELAFSEHWKTETNKAFLVSETDEVIYLAKAVKPTFDPFPGSYNDAQTVAIDAGGAEIEYSTDGGDNWYPYTGPITVDKDMTIIARTEGVGETAEATGVYVINKPVETISIKGFKGYFQIKNNGNGKYANVAGRKTLNFVDDPADKAGTVIYADIQKDGKVLSLRSQAADLQRYADRAVSYVPEIVRLVAQKLNADGTGSILGANGLDAILAKFDESFDHHLYVDSVDGGYRIFGRTPSMQPVVDFYRENTAQVEAKLPMLESFINSALNKLKEKIGGSSVFTPFSLLNIWECMGGTLTKPEDEASTMAFYREVLNNKNYVWDFAYQTAMIYLNNIKDTQTYQNLVNEHPEISQYIDKIDQIRPDFKYYIVQKDDKPDFISQGNVDIINNEARTIWTLEERKTFKLNSASELFGCPLATNGVGGYFTTNYTDFAYTLPEGVTAYKVTGVNDEGEATLEALSGTIPAQTPVLLVAKEDKPYELTLTTDAGTAVTGNLLVGPDYLINEYDLKTAQVQGIFDMIKQKLGQDFYNNYVAQYEHLADLNSGTVNNKYFWNVNSYLDYCTYKNANNEDECVVRSLATNENGELAFSEHWKTETNKAFLVSDTFDVITLPSLERGDVNHDGYVNLIDVTDLIDRLLVIPDAEHLKACPYCSDVDGNGSVSIKDVTVLIDILLENPATDPEGGDGN